MDKRELILEATLQLVLQEGFYHLNMKKVAKAAGVAAGTIYLYFPSKDELILELYRYVMKLYLEAMMAGFDEEQDLEPKLKGIARNFLGFFLRRLDCFSLLQQFRTSPFIFKDKEARSLLLEPLTVLVEKARDQGLVKNLPTHILFALVIGPMYEAINMWQAGYIDLQLPELQEQFMSACWANIAQPATSVRKVQKA